MDNDSKLYFENKLYYDPIYCLGHFHTINYVDIVDCQDIELELVNKAGSTHKLTLRHSKMDFSVNILKGNRFYHEHKSQYVKDFKCKDHEINHTIQRKHIQLFGLTVADIIRLFKLFNPNKEESESDESDESDNNDKLFDKFIKRGLSSSSNPQSDNFLGISNHYSGIYLWDSLAKNADKSLDNFYAKKVYFSWSDIYNLVTRTPNKHELGRYLKTINPESFDKLLRKIVTLDLIKKLYRYYYFKENPETNILGDDIYYFEEPITVPEALKRVYEINKNPEYMFYYHQLMKPNNNELKKLDYKFNNTVITKTLRKLGNDFPFFTLRNVIINHFNYSKIKKGCFSVSSINSDFDVIRDLFTDYKRLKRNDKLKFKETISDKVISSNTLYYYNHYLKHNRMYGTNSRIKLKHLAKDELSELDDLENIDQDLMNDEIINM